MKKLLLISAAFAVLLAPAMAAEKPVRVHKRVRPVVVAAPLYTWTGFYVGGNLGASFGNVKTDFNVAPPAATVSVTGIVSGTSGFIPPLPGFAGSNTEYPRGFIGGGQIGYNWQLSPIWVAGLEADFQGALEKDSNTLTGGKFVSLLTNPALGLGAGATGSTALDFQTKIEWFGTARVRVGYVWGNGEVMSYVTGGLAYAKVDLEGTSTLNGTFQFGQAFSVTQTFGHSQVNTGWTVGTGTEGKLLIPGWTYRIEYLYMDLGHLDATGVISGSSCTGCTFSLAGGQVTTHTHFADNIVRFGLNYKFGNYYAPVVTK